MLHMGIGTFIQHLDHCNVWQSKFLLFFLTGICLTTIKFISWESPAAVTKLEWTHHSKPQPTIMLPYCRRECVCQLRWEHRHVWLVKDATTNSGTEQNFNRVLLLSYYCHSGPPKHEACLSRKTAILTEAVFSWVRSC